MKNYSPWQNNEIKNLFNMIESYKQKNIPLLKAFDDYAKLSGRKRNSVRNYYYAEISELKKNENKRTLLDIDLKKHEISETKIFSTNETKNLIDEINKKRANGISIRKACLELANGDATKMVRYQNKYRMMTKENKKLDNVIYMQKKENKSISEKDIDSLFLGLIRLVKKSASETIQQKLAGELEFSNSSLRKTLVKLNKTETELNISLEKIKNLNLELDKLKSENQELRSSIANIFNKNKTKTKKLSEFLNEVKNKQKNVNIN